MGVAGPRPAYSGTSVRTQSRPCPGHSIHLIRCRPSTRSGEAAVLPAPLPSAVRRRVTADQPCPVPEDRPCWHAALLHPAHRPPSMLHLAVDSGRVSVRLVTSFLESPWSTSLLTKTSDATMLTCSGTLYFHLDVSTNSAHTTPAARPLTNRLSSRGQHRHNCAWRSRT